MDHYIGRTVRCGTDNSYNRPFHLGNRLHDPTFPADAEHNVTCVANNGMEVTYRCTCGAEWSFVPQVIVVPD